MNQPVELPEESVGGWVGEGFHSPSRLGRVKHRFQGKGDTFMILLDHRLLVQLLHFWFVSGILHHLPRSRGVSQNLFPRDPVGPFQGLFQLLGSGMCQPRGRPHLGAFCSPMIFHAVKAWPLAAN